MARRRTNPDALLTLGRLTTRIDMLKEQHMNKTAKGLISKIEQDVQDLGVELGCASEDEGED